MDFSNYKKTLIKRIKDYDLFIAFCIVNNIGFSHWSEKKTVDLLRLKRIKAIEAKIDARSN